jgi:hypothetical protein
MKEYYLLLLSVLKKILVFIGLVLIWRGVWVLIDKLETALFAGNSLLFGFFNILLGLGLIWLIDRKLKSLI